MEKMKDVWDIVVDQKMRLRVSFNKHLTKEGAINAFLRDDWDDILDEEPYEVIKVHDEECK